MGAVDSHFLNGEDFWKPQNQKVLTFENLQSHGLTISAVLLYLPYDLVMGLRIVRNVTLKPALENTVYCKGNEGGLINPEKNLNSQALGRTKRKTDLG